MQADKTIRVLLTLVVVLVSLAVLVVALVLTEKLFVVWDHISASPRPIFYAYLAGFAVVCLLTGRLVWRLLRAGPARAVSKQAPDLSEQGIESRLAEAQSLGMDVAQAERELAELSARRATGEVYVAMFGQVSTGKSSLVKAMLPQAQVQVSVVGGSTRQIQHYEWSSSAGDRLILTDVPGLAEADGHLDDLAREEARRAHVVIYVCDSDLTRAEYRELSEIRALRKPVLVALNKADQYSAQELAQVRERINDRLQQQVGEAGEGAELSPVEVVPVSAAREEQVVRVDEQGRESRVVRERAPDVQALRNALQLRIDADAGALANLRDSSVFLLVSNKLDAAQSKYRREQSEQLVGKYTRRAVVGALAAVAPGTDLLIQGFLGAQMVREMCKLYDAPVRDMDVQKFLDLSQDQVARATPLLLAVAGNGAKAFPGLGTIAGGLMHAVAYGLIFDALGRALAATLQASGTLRPVPAAIMFKEALGGDLESRTRRVARLALEARSDNAKD